MRKFLSTTIKGSIFLSDSAGSVLSKIMCGKNSNIDWKINQNAPISNAVEILLNPNHQSAGALGVYDTTGKIVGILSERDCIGTVFRRSSKMTKVNLHYPGCS